jgi:hypothetical protein
MGFQVDAPFGVFLIPTFRYGPGCLLSYSQSCRHIISVVPAWYCAAGQQTAPQWGHSLAPISGTGCAFTLVGEQTLPTEGGKQQKLITVSDDLLVGVCERRHGCTTYLASLLLPRVVWTSGPPLRVARLIFFGYVASTSACIAVSRPAFRPDATEPLTWLPDWMMRVMQRDPAPLHPSRVTTSGSSWLLVTFVIPLRSASRLTCYRQ